MRRTILLSLAWLGFFLGCSGENRDGDRSLLVFCGSANKPAMEEIARGFESETGTEVNLTFGGSGTLLSQIELTRKGEIYLPGSPDYIIIGERKKLLIPGRDRIVAYLVPAIITPTGNPAKVEGLDDLVRPGVRVGIGNPETVCLGLYGVEILDKNGLLGPMMGNVVTFGGSCSKTANLAAMGKVDAILGWRVFHFWNPARMDWVPIAPDRIPRISYVPIAVPVHSKDPALSGRFIEYVLSPAGRAAYEKFGYIVSREEAMALAPEATIGGEYVLTPRYFELLKNQKSVRGKQKSVGKTENREQANPDCGFPRPKVLCLKPKDAG